MQEALNLLGSIIKTRDPIKLLPEKHRPKYETFFPMDKGLQIFTAPSATYPKIARRYLGDYCRIAAVPRSDIIELSNLTRISRKAGRVMRIGDMGCGRGNAIKPFYGEEGIEAYGIDTRVNNRHADNIHIMNGDFTDPESPFWHNQYDYLFCVLVAQYLKIGINEVISLMKAGLSDSGKGYLVIPIYSDESYEPTYIFDPNILPSDIKVTMPIRDPLHNNTLCASLKFRK